MEQLRRLTAQQLILSACAATATAGVMLAQASALAFVPLVLAGGCAIAAGAKAWRR